MLYKELNLAKIRKDYDLDFAHFTYQPGMCSCCYGPKDLPKRYWKGGIVSTEDYDNIEYLLFKNSDNGSGHVRRNDKIVNYTCIEWQFDESKLIPICKDLQAQLGDEYVVLVPKDIGSCIIIFKADYPLY